MFFASRPANLLWLDVLMLFNLCIIYFCVDNTLQGQWLNSKKSKNQSEAAKRKVRQKTLKDDGGYQFRELLTVWTTTGRRGIQPDSVAKNRNGTNPSANTPKNMHPVTEPSGLSRQVVWLFCTPIFVGYFMKDLLIPTYCWVSVGVFWE